jgi:3-oxoadipate enol-lactonase
MATDDSRTMSGREGARCEVTVDVEAGYADIDGARLYYETAGAGEAVVFIHGFALDRRMWDAQMAPFAARFRAVRYDLRGFGRSAPPAGAPYSHAGDLLALLRRLGIARASLVGLSLGGAVAADAALAAPEMVARLVLADALLSGHRWSDAWHAAAGPAWALGRAGDLAGARRAWLAHPLFAPALANERAAPHLRGMVEDYSGWHWAHRDPVRDPQPPALARLGAIRAPTLIVMGERDLPDFWAIARAAQQGIPGAQTVVLPGVGHLANMEAPERFNQVVLGFLAGR